MKNGTTKESLLTQELVKKLFNYDRDTGVLSRNKTVAYNAKEGDIVGTVDNRGYGRVKIKGLPYRTHRIAWLYEYGVFPTHGLDHINNDKLDNRICNLRDVPQLINNQNASLRKDNTSGCPGLKKTVSGKWAAHINVDGNDIYLGTFCDKAEAVATRRAAETKYWLKEIK